MEKGPALALAQFLLRGTRALALLPKPAAALRPGLDAAGLGLAGAHKPGEAQPGHAGFGLFVEGGVQVGALDEIFAVKPDLADQNGHLVKSFALKQPTGCFFIWAAPLLEEERHARVGALLLNVQHPTFLYWPGVWPRLSAYDYPINPGQVEIGQWPKQGLQRQKFDLRRSAPQMVDAARYLLVFHRNAHPYIGWPVQCRTMGLQQLAALGQHLKRMAGAVVHHLKYPLNEGQWNLGMKQVAHRIDEHLAGCFPSVRAAQLVFVNRNFKPGGILGYTHCQQPLGHGFGVAVFAASGNLRTTRGRVPRHFRPFDA